MRRQDLQRDQATETQVQGAVHDSHAATTNALLDLVPGELLAWSKITRSGLDVLRHC
jgi:hypothetical protein